MINNKNADNLFLLKSDIKKYFSGYFRSGKITILLRDLNHKNASYDPYDGQQNILKNLITEIGIFLRIEVANCLKHKHAASDLSELFSVF